MKFGHGSGLIEKTLKVHVYVLSELYDVQYFMYSLFENGEHKAYTCTHVHKVCANARSLSAI